jgi:hypothetical protein
LKEESLELYGAEAMTWLSSQEFKQPEHSVSLRDKNRVYRVSSALQKCIRRGLPEQAVYYAQAIYNSSEQDYLWRRLPIIALEDVGIADIKLCAAVLHFCRFASVRVQVGSKWGLSVLVDLLARGNKSRTLCDLMCSVLFAKTLPEQSIAKQSAMDMITWGFKADMGHPAHNWWPVEKREDMVAAVQKQFGPAAAYCMYAGSKKSVSNLHAPIRLAMQGAESDHTETYVIDKSSEVRDLEMIKGIPDWAFDQHTSEGKRAIAHVCKSSKVLAEFAKTHASVTSEQLGMVLFQVESALLDRQVASPWILEVQHLNDAEEAWHVGLDAVAAEHLRLVLRSQEFKSELLVARKKMLT